MTTFEQLTAIARNTFTECIRQPVVLVVLVAGVLLLVMSIPFSGFTLMDDQRMFVDLALSNIFMCGAILAAFLATNALRREIDNKTVLTVVSKPVPRPVFAWGKWLGVAAALTAVTLLLAFVFMLVEMHGTMPTVATPYHFPVLTFGLTAALATAGAAVWANYFYGWAVSSSTLIFGVPIMGVAYLISLLFTKNWSTSVPVSATDTIPAIVAQFEGNLWVALLVLWIGLLVLTGAAVAASTRFGQVVTLGITIGLFILGLMSDWLFARPIAGLQKMFSEMTAAGTPVGMLDWANLKYGLLKVGYAVVPNFQIFWLSDAVQQGKTIPAGYVATSAAYGLVMIVATMSVAVILFQRREVG